VKTGGAVRYRDEDIQAFIVSGLSGTGADVATGGEIAAQ
jgi:hypothetical protein